MSFVRSKEIPPRSGNWYDYLVETYHEKGHVRQRVLKYLGKSTHRASRSVAGGGMVVSPKAQRIGTTPTRITKMKTGSRLIASALGMYYGGMALDAIQQQFRQDHDLDMSESNYWNWVVRFTKAAQRQLRGFRPHVSDTWIADETYMKLGKRTVYFWDIIDPKTNYLLASHVSFSRGAREARMLMRKAAERAGRSPRYIRTDKLRSYISAIEDQFGANTKHIQGGPFKTVGSGESTAEIERFHRTLEQRTRVFQKFKDIESIKLLTQGWLINYNFFKQNEGCGNVPPAQVCSTIVPFKDWNDVVIPAGEKDVDYHVALHYRKSVRKGYPVADATLTPIKDNGEVGASWG